MPRVVAILLGLLAVAAVLVAMVGYLAYGTGPGEAAEARVPGLSGEVAIGRSDSAATVVAATTEADLFAGLGYAHALDNAWPMALRRQVATGTLSEWIYDRAAYRLDRHARALGLGPDARRAYDALPDAERALLDAYAAGVNAAFDANALVRGDDFVMLNVEPEPWRPWDALAVERLIAYLATPAPAPPDSVSAGPAADTTGTVRARDDVLRETPELARFLETDSLFRAYLHLGGMESGLAVAARDSGGVGLAQRIVTGGSALPLVQPIELRLGGRSTLVGSVPGTLALPAGFGEDAAWAVLLTTPARLEIATGEPPEPSHDRIVLRGGDERLVTARRGGGALFITEETVPDPDTRPPLPPDSLSADSLTAADSVPPDSAVAPAARWWTLRWRGFDGGTDFAAWRALLAGETPAFGLFDGGLALGSDGAATVLGAPSAVRETPGGIVVGADSAAVRYVAERLAVPRDSAALDLARLGADAFSAWAADLAPPLIAALGGPDSTAAEFDLAGSYLRSWDFRYAPDAIGASIFERWMMAYEDATGALPRPDSLALRPVTEVDTLQITFAELVRDSVLAAREAGRRRPAIADSLDADSTLADSVVTTTRTRTEDTADLRLLKQALRQALAELRDGFGRAGSPWRWDRVQGATLAFPVWSDSARAGRLGRGRYRPAPLADGGHPTALAWGRSPLRSPLFPGARAPAAWAAWTWTGDWGAVRVRAREPYREGLTERYADDPEPSTARRLARGAEPDRVIRLRPPS